MRILIGECIQSDRGVYCPKLIGEMSVFYVCLQANPLRFFCPIEILMTLVQSSGRAASAWIWRVHMCTCTHINKPCHMDELPHTFERVMSHIAWVTLTYTRVLSCIAWACVTAQMRMSHVTHCTSRYSAHMNAPCPTLQETFNTYKRVMSHI